MDKIREIWKENKTQNSLSNQQTHCHEHFVTQKSPKSYDLTPSKRGF
jgi:hypothetical protein